MQNNNGHYQYTKDFEDYSNKRKEKVLRGALGKLVVMTISTL